MQESAKKLHIGIDVGGTKIAYGLFDEANKLIGRWQEPADRKATGEQLADGLNKMVGNICTANCIGVNDLVGVGIAVPSFVLYKEGYILKTSNLPNVKEFAIRDYMQSRLNAKVYVENDGNAAALAEHQLGAGKGFEHMLLCPVSTGCSSAIIINGKIFHGSYGWAGESGHTLITPDLEGPECGCGNQGCFMSHISGSMISGRVKKWLDDGEQSVIRDMLNGNTDGITAEHIHKAAEIGDALALKAVEHMAHYMAMWLFNIYQILNINCFVFSGGLVNFGDLLFEKAFHYFHLYNKNNLPVYFKFAELGKDAGIIGAGLLVD